MFVLLFCCVGCCSFLFVCLFCMLVRSFVCFLLVCVVCFVASGHFSVCFALLCFALLLLVGFDLFCFLTFRDWVLFFVKYFCLLVVLFRDVLSCLFILFRSIVSFRLPAYAHTFSFSFSQPPGFLFRFACTVPPEPARAAC